MIRHTLVIIVALADGHAEDVAKMVYDDLGSEKVEGFVASVVRVFAGMNTISRMGTAVKTSTGAKSTKLGYRTRFW